MIDKVDFTSLRNLIDKQPLVTSKMLMSIRDYYDVAVWGRMTDVPGHFKYTLVLARQTNSNIAVYTPDIFGMLLNDKNEQSTNYQDSYIVDLGHKRKIPLVVEKFFFSKNKFPAFLYVEIPGIPAGLKHISCVNFDAPRVNGGIVENLSERLVELNVLHVELPDWCPKINKNGKLSRKITKTDCLKVALEFDREYAKYLMDHFLEGDK